MHQELQSVFKICRLHGIFTGHLPRSDGSTFPEISTWVHRTLFYSFNQVKIPTVNGPRTHCPGSKVNGTFAGDLDSSCMCAWRAVLVPGSLPSLEKQGILLLQTNLRAIFLENKTYPMNPKISVTLRPSSAKKTQCVRKALRWHETWKPRVVPQTNSSVDRIACAYMYNLYWIVDGTK